MYQQKKQWCVLHAKLFKLFVGGALLLAVSPAYAAIPHILLLSYTRMAVLLQVQLSMKPVKLLLVPMW